MDESEARSPEPVIEDFLDEPTRDLDDWKWLWASDRPFPIRSHRGVFGRLLVFFKRLLRPLVRLPTNDLWERQRVFNLIVLEYLQRIQDLRSEVDDLRSRVALLEEYKGWGLEAVMAHNDALFARVDQKLDRYRRRTQELRRHHEALFSRLDQKLDLYRRDARELTGELGAALALAESGQAAPLAAARDELGYVDLERHFRGSESEIEGRIGRYVKRLEGRGEVLDLGCGRGEALALFGEHGIPARGVDSSSAMVAKCRDKGLEAETGDLFEALEEVEPGSLGGVVSFHVIEHLPPESLDRLVRLAWRALKPGGVLILETPSPLSLVMSARNFWIDPTHRRPVHPESLKLMFRRAGFDTVEQLDLSPFADDRRLPAVATEDLSPELRELADRVNRLRDSLDEVLYGYQDFAMIGVKAAPAAPGQ